jgi:hypothetical protein
MSISGHGEGFSASARFHSRHVRDEAMRRMLFAVISAVLMPTFVGCCCTQTYYDPMACCGSCGGGCGGCGYGGYGCGNCGYPSCGSPCGGGCCDGGYGYGGYGNGCGGCGGGCGCCILTPICSLLHHIFCPSCWFGGGYGPYGGGYCGGPCYGGCGYGGGCGFNGCCEPGMVFNDGGCGGCGGCGYPSPCGSCCGGSPIMQGYQSGGCSSCGVQPGLTTPPTPVPTAPGPATPPPTTMYNPAPYSQTMPVVQGAGGPILDSRYQAVTPARY